MKKTKAQLAGERTAAATSGLQQAHDALHEAAQLASAAEQEHLDAVEFHQAEAARAANTVDRSTRVRDRIAELLA